MDQPNATTDPASKGPPAPPELPDLPAEVWDRIIRFLRRDQPRPFHMAEWKDLHQQDLTVISRVSSTLHELTIPHLYTSVDAYSLSMLLKFGTITNPFTSSANNPKISSKKNRLERIRRLHVAKRPRPMTWSMSMSPEGSEDGSEDGTQLDVPPEDTELDLRRKRAHLRCINDDFESVRNLVAGANRNRSPSFDRLDRLIISASRAWFRDQPLPIANRILATFTSFIHHCRPLHVCHEFGKLYELWDIDYTPDEYGEGQGWQPEGRWTRISFHAHLDLGDSPNPIFTKHALRRFLQTIPTHIDEHCSIASLGNALSMCAESSNSEYYIIGPISGEPDPQMRQEILPLLEFSYHHMSGCDASRRITSTRHGDAVCPGCGADCFGE